MPCRFGGFLEIRADPEGNWPAGQIAWSYPEDAPTVKPPPPSAEVLEELKARSPAEEVWWLVQKAYKEQGKPVPVKEAKACLDAIKEEKKPKEPEPERPKTAEEILGPRPVYGDPAFWPWWNKAKALGLVKPKEKKEKKSRGKKSD